MRTGLTKQEKTTDIWFDEKNPLTGIRAICCIPFCNILIFFELITEVPASEAVSIVSPGATPVKIIDPSSVF